MSAAYIDFDQKKKKGEIPTAPLGLLYDNWINKEEIAHWST